MGAVSRARTPLDAPLTIFLVFPTLGAVIGLFRENDLRLLASDLFPYFEYYAFFLLSSMMINESGKAKALALAMILWGSTVAFTQVILYILLGDVFVVRFALAGGDVTVPRLVDFMPAVLLPLAVSIFCFSTSRRVMATMGVSSAILVAALMLSFFRTLWLGVIVSGFVIFWFAMRTPGGKPSRLLLLLAAMLISITVFPARWIGHFESPGGSILEIVVARITYVEPVSGIARVEDNIDLMNAIATSPLIGKGLGATYQTDYGEFPLFSASNFFLSLAATMGLPALLLFLLVCFAVLKSWLAMFRGSKLTAEEKGVSLGIVASLSAVGVSLLFFPSLLHFPIPAHSGILSALLFIIHRQPSRAVHAESIPRQI
jgi:hypothetical protein